MITLTHGHTESPHNWKIVATLVKAMTNVPACVPVYMSMCAHVCAITLYTVHNYYKRLHTHTVHRYRHMYTHTHKQ